MRAAGVDGIVRAALEELLMNGKDFYAIAQRHPLRPLLALLIVSAATLPSAVFCQDTPTDGLTFTDLRGAKHEDVKVLRVEDGALIGGQVGIADHRRIGAGAMVGAKSGVTRDVKPGEQVSGYPAMGRWEWLRVMAKLKK